MGSTEGIDREARGRDGDGWSERELGLDRLSADALLRAAHGFLVDTTRGREVGVVDDIITDHTTGRVNRIEVCGGWFGRRRRTIDVTDIRAIDPGRRRLVVSASLLEDELR